MHRVKTRLAVHAVAHFAVDFSCFFALWAFTLRQQNAPLMVLLYNALAFVLQAPLGALADRVDDVRPFTILGCGLVVWGVLSCAFGLPSVILLGLGNALFHVGGAVATLRHRPGDARAAGIFVAPGALGVALGTLAGKSLQLSPITVAFLLFVILCIIWGVGAGAPRACTAFRASSPMEGLGTAAIMLCLVSIGVRSFAGFAVTTLTGTAAFALLGAGASFSGKLFGGIFARKVPWRVIGLIGVGVGGLLMAFFPASYVTYFGVFLFNLAMPLTLSAVMAAMPDNMGLGFGLTTLALFLGCSPLYALPDGYKASVPVMLAATLTAAFMLFFALRVRRPLSPAVAPNLAEESPPAAPEETLPAFDAPPSNEPASDVLPAVEEPLPAE